MDRLRRSIRQSFRRQRSTDPPQLVAGASSVRERWQTDDAAVRAGVCAFNVKYLGAVEVYDSRGMGICEGALKMLRNQKRKPVKAILYVSGDGLRVVDTENNRGLMVDQTIEKVSFCAPDRSNDKGFAYICRDGTSRRWMCHGFQASKDSGERLSHAVGCAFEICLERKKKRDEETSTLTTNLAEKGLNPDWGEKQEDASPLQRTNPAYQTFRKQISISERLQDPQAAIVSNGPGSSSARILPPTAKPRPSSNPALFQRQGSLRAPETTMNSQFKRNYSVRTGSVDTAVSTLNFGKSLHNEPIYEGDEDVPTSATAPPSTTHQVNTALINPSTSFDSIGMNGTATIQPSPATSSAMVNTGMPLSPSEWSMFEKPLATQTPAMSPQPIFVNTQSPQRSQPEPPLTNRSKADEWLDFTLKSSLTVSSAPPSHITPSPSLPTVSSTSNWPGQSTPNGLVNGFHMTPSGYSQPSGPPPQTAPPPLPSKNPVTSIAPTSNIRWETASNNSVPKPADPFDIQWSRNISNTNPFLDHSTRITT